MSISERVDLVGNVSSQAKKWLRDIQRLGAAMKKLPAGMGGGAGRGGPRVGGGGGRAPKQHGPGRDEFYRQRAKQQADALRQERATARATAQAERSKAREQAKAARATEAAARAEAKAAAMKARAEARMPQYGPGRREAQASAAARQREQAAATRANARAEAAAAKSSARAHAQATREKEKAQKSWNASQAKSHNAAIKHEQEQRKARMKAYDAQRGRKGSVESMFSSGSSGAKGKGKGGGPGDGMGGALASMTGNLLADAAMAAIGQLTAMMKSMASTFVAAQVFKENTLAGLTILEKSGTAARKTWEESFKIARDTGTTQQESMSAIQGMMASGFKKGDAVELYKLMTALSVVNPAANLEGITRAISQIKNTGKLQGDELLQLADAGVNIDKVYEHLGKRLKKSRDEIIKMQGAGEIKAADAIEAIKAATRDSVGGDVDGVLKKKADSISSIMARLQAAPFTFFAGMEQDPAIAEKMKASLKSLVDLLDPSTAKGKQMATAFAKLIDLVAGPGADAFAHFVDKGPAMIAMLEKMAPLASALGTAIVMAAAQVQGMIDGVNMMLAPITALADQIERLTSMDTSKFEKLSALFKTGGPAPIPGLSNSLGGAAPANDNASGGNALSGMLSQAIGSGSAEASAGGSTMGSQLIAGMISGIMGGTSGVVAAIVAMAAQAVGAGQASLQIHSPSRVFQWQGEQIPEGMAKGVRDNIAIVERDVMRMGGAAANTNAIPYAGDAIARRVGQQGNLGARNVTIGSMRASNQINVSTPQQGGEQAAKGFDEMFDAKLAQFFEKRAS